MNPSRLTDAPFTSAETAAQAMPNATGKASSNGNACASVSRSAHFVDPVEVGPPGFALSVREHRQDREAVEKFLDFSEQAERSVSSRSPWAVFVAVSKQGKLLFEQEVRRSPISVGASPDCDVVLADRFVSNLHGQLLVTRGQLHYRDCSTNGSYVDGKKVTELKLNDGDTIEITPFEISAELRSRGGERTTAVRDDTQGIIRDLVLARAASAKAKSKAAAAAGDSGPETVPDVAARADLRKESDDLEDQETAPVGGGPVSGPLHVSLSENLESAGDTTNQVDPTSLGHVRLTLESLDGHGTIAMPQRSVKIGRSREADVQIDHPMLSRMHSEIRYIPGVAYVACDLESTNGTYVNSKRVDEAQLNDGDKLSFGRLSYTVRLDLPEVGGDQDSDRTGEETSVLPSRIKSG